MYSEKSRILCIDNDPSIYDWINAALQNAKVNCDVSMAGTGREALQLLSKQAFDLCILDYALPDMTGVQLCTMMRRNGHDVPVMFFTAMDRAIDRERAAEAGANEYLCKPDDMDIFVDVAAHLMQMRRVVYSYPKRFSNFSLNASV